MTCLISKPYTSKQKNGKYRSYKKQGTLGKDITDHHRRMRGK